MNFLGGLSIVFCVIAIFYNNINFEVMVYSTSFLLCFIAYEIWSSPEQTDNKESIIPNEKNQEYFLNLGYEVKNFMAMQLNHLKPKIIILFIIFF